MSYAELNLLKSSSFFMSVIASTEATLKRDLKDSEENMIIECMRKMPPIMTEKYTPADLIKIITKTVVSEIQLLNRQNNDVDTHELLKRTMGNTIDDSDNDCYKDTSNNVAINLESFFGVKDFGSLIKHIKEPVNSVNRAYFVLDTRYRVLTNDGTRYFQWNHINNLSLSQGTVNSLGNIRDIISMKLTHFRIPAVASADTPYKRISVLVHELGTQAFIAHENVRYHFLGNLDDHNLAPGWMEIDPTKNFGGEFKFNKSITHIDTMTVSLGSPLEPVIFDPDRLDARITSFASPVTFTFSQPHNLLNGNTVYITSYNSANPQFDGGILSSINMPTGLTATVTGPNVITAPIDMSGLRFNLTGSVNAAAASNIIDGVGTNFLGELHVGDHITIYDGGINPSYTIKSIQSATRLMLVTPYNGVAGIGFAAEKNNILTDIVNVYFGSKRIFFSFELTYLSS